MRGSILGSHCHRCLLHRRAQRNPNGWLARLWRWHTRWCPGWRAYQKTLTEQDEQADRAEREANHDGADD